MQGPARWRWSAPTSASVAVIFTELNDNNLQTNRSFDRDCAVLAAGGRAVSGKTKNPYPYLNEPFFLSTLYPDTQNRAAQLAEMIKKRSVWGCEILPRTHPAHPSQSPALAVTKWRGKAPQTLDYCDGCCFVLSSLT